MEERKTIREWLETIADDKIRNSALGQGTNLDATDTSLYCALHGFALWSDTKEGDGYWGDVADRAHRGELETITNTKMEDLKIRVHNPEHDKAIQKRLFELGCEWFSGGKSIYTPNKKYISVSSIGIMSYGDSLESFNECPHKEVTLDYLYTIKPDTPIEVKLNSNHTAKVTKDKVVVGCQEFTFKSIKELYEAVKKKES